MSTEDAGRAVGAIHHLDHIRHYAHNALVLLGLADVIRELAMRLLEAIR